MVATSRRKTDSPHQLSLFRRGGARRGAGRKPNGPRPLVSHAKRPRLAARFPVLVTTRIAQGLPSMRRETTLAFLRVALRAGSDRPDFRLVHFSIQSNHLHFIVEASSADSLSRGMQGLLVRLAKRLNRLWGHHGTVFPDRYHERILRSPREVRYALVYVLHNARKHGVRYTGIDPFSSGRWFDGWKNRTGRLLDAAEQRTVPVAEPRTYLLRTGWRRHGLIDVGESPASAPGLRASA